MKARAWSDGGNRSDIAAAACHLILEDGTEIKRSLVRHGEWTNMEMEYCGVILAMEVALEAGVTDLVLHVDNQTVERHLIGTYKVREPRMKTYHTKCMDLGEKFNDVAIFWVKRNMNKVADKLCRDAMDGTPPKRPAKRARPTVLKSGSTRANPFRAADNSEFRGKLTRYSSASR